MVFDVLPLIEHHYGCYSSLKKYNYIKHTCVEVKRQHIAEISPWRQNLLRKNAEYVSRKKTNNKAYNKRLLQMDRLPANSFQRNDASAQQLTGNTVQVV